MDKNEFIAEIQNLLVHNGSVKELQTKIRAELIQILMNKKQLQPNRDISDVEKTLNYVIIEHLMQCGLWYTASVMSAEAEFIEPPPEIETVISNNSKTVTRRHNPSRISSTTLNNILRRLDLESSSSLMLSEYERSRNKSVLSLIVRICAENTLKRKSSEELVTGFSGRFELV